MACRGFFECILKLLNFVVMVVGMAVTGYGVYLLVMWFQLLTPPPEPAPAPAVAPSGDLVRLGRPMLLLLLDASLPDGTVERLSSAWFIFALIGIGVVLFITSIFGCAGASSRSGCCLSTVSMSTCIVINMFSGATLFPFLHDDFVSSVRYQVMKDIYIEFMSLGRSTFSKMWDYYCSQNDMRQK